MPKAVNYTNEEILLALIWSMPNKLTKGQIGRLMNIKSAGQKHWRERLEKLGERNLISTERLDAGELFHGSPILKYYISEKNIEAIWDQYFVNYDDEHHPVVNDPFLTPFSEGIWNVSTKPEFSKLVGSAFNYHFLCAKNGATPFEPKLHFKSLSKEKIWKIMEAVLSISWKVEAYGRKPPLLSTLCNEQKMVYKGILSLYSKQIKEHPADYKKYKALFDRNFKKYM